jgi:hypothetical protein
MFSNRNDCYYRQRDTGAYLLVEEPITGDILRKHFSGEVTLCLPAISREGTCKYLAWDDDNDDPWRLNRIEMWLQSLHLNPLKEGARANRAGHIWIFLSEPLSSQEAFTFGQHSKIFNAIPDIEFFPKQATVKPGGVGNGIRLPLGHNRKPGVARATSLFSGCLSYDYRDQVQWVLQQPLSQTTNILQYLKSTALPIIDSKSKPRRKTVSPQGSLLDLVPEDWPLKELPSGEIMTRCPMCDSEGHDKTAANLYINPQENVLYCHWNNGNHTFKQIISAFKLLKRGLSVQRILGHSVR